MNHRHHLKFTMLLVNHRYRALELSPNLCRPSYRFEILLSSIRTSSVSSFSNNHNCAFRNYVDCLACLESPSSLANRYFSKMRKNNRVVCFYRFIAEILQFELKFLS